MGSAHSDGSRLPFEAIRASSAHRGGRLRAKRFEAVPAAVARVAQSRLRQTEQGEVEAYVRARMRYTDLHQTQARTARPRSAQRLRIRPPPAPTGMPIPQAAVPGL